MLLSNSLSSAKCTDPEDIENGDVSFTTTTLGSKASYECDDGFELKGVVTRTCVISTITGTAVWSPKPPVCERKI